MSIIGSLPPFLKEENVQAFAGTKYTKAFVAYPQSIEDCRRVIEYAKNQKLTICPRGKGYTYGDMILNNGHIILNTTQMRKVIAWDSTRGIMVVEPGVQFRDVFLLGLPASWVLGACPGGMGVTIGGALSNNVHGKDSWRVGNFGDQVISCKILTAQGEVIILGKNVNGELFNAIPGSMGLFGIIVEVTLQLRKVPSPFVEVITTPARNIEESIALLEASRLKSDFSVAWVDAFAKESRLGRGFVTSARFIESREIMKPARLASSLTMAKRIFNILPSKPTWRLLRPFFNPFLIKAANQMMYYASSVKGIQSHTALFTEYNFMHNKIPDLNYVYAPQGFLEFEPIVPRRDGVRHLSNILRLCQDMHGESLLCAVKMHSADEYPLSFSGDGYSIGIDIQLRGRAHAQVSKMSDALFNYTRDCGGRIYLGKDERLNPEVFRQMYPHVDEFMRIKREVDPTGLFSSDMYRRLFV